MDIGTLLAALTAADTGAKESNPFAPLQSASDGIGAAFIQNSPKFNTKDNLLGGLLLGLTSGITGNLANTYQDKQSGLAEDVLMQALRGQSMERPDGLSPSVFSKLEQTGNLFAAERKYEAEQAATAAAQKRAETIFTSGLENYDRTKYNLDKMTGGPAAAPGAIENELDPLLKKYNYDETAARDELKYNRDAPERLTGLRKEFESLPEVKLFSVADSGFKSMQKAFADPKGTSDIELSRGGIQAIEPGLAVRLDDFQAIQQSPSLSDSMKAELTGALSGTSRLSADTRKGLMRIAARRYAEAANKFNLAKGFYSTQAEKAGLDPKGITFLPDGVPAPEYERLGLPPVTPEEARAKLKAMGVPGY